MFTSSSARAACLSGVIGALALGALGTASTVEARTSAAQTTVPPIYEPFTHQLCPAKAVTTVQLENCAADKVLVLDRQIDSLDTKIVAKLPKTGQATFAVAAKSWLTYRAAVAKASSSPYGGGTIAPVVELTTLASEDRAHIQALTREFTSLDGQRP